ncbi:MAG: hypothetical protein GY712_02945 [Oceanicoccus sp.]|uniref:protein YgfX n=1 Tax=Oceanicoccus sp. TaxID=2691044 RepID=UPI0026246F31|nr:protein YgfX [Oceanicoccus sp.]MCP3906953.1 hypothetical protein [Oceanicoccus sp.]MDG1771872.1 hypothetical protein [Oceanicoccus sp.]
MKTPAFTLSITPSKWIASYLIVLHLLLLLSLHYLALSGVSMVLISVAMVAHGLYSLWRYCSQRHPAWINGLEYSHQLWLLHRVRGPERAQLKSATVWRRMVVLNFRGEGRCCSLVLLADSTSPQQLRRLRVMLKHRPVYNGLIP